MRRSYLGRMASRKRPDWSRPLPRPLEIPTVMTLATLAHVRKLIDHLPKASRNKNTWQHVARQLNDAARGGDIRDLEVSLWLVMTLERLEWQKN
jgi:hypothetical protein